jgi:peptide-methionine (R)-S-oxide reductase
MMLLLKKLLNFLNKMIEIKYLFLIILFLINSSSFSQQKLSKMTKKISKTEAEWKSILSPQQYYVLREKGTDAPSEKGYTSFFEKGTYVCAACGTQLFKSNSKFESHCGWPSFDDAIEGKVKYVLDKSHGMIRTEIICATCGGHLGHVFEDGPTETTGKRFCVNTTSIKFIKQE